MKEPRDFKGVWIPKEIWLNEELTMLEKVIFIEIDSLDNENHCTAGNEYFATFCNCSESKVTKSIKKLQDLNMIEVVSFDGRHRKIRVVKNTRQSSKKYEAESQKVRPNNIDNNPTNKKELLSKDNNSTEFTFGKQNQKPKKENLYAKCVSLIDSYDFSSWGNIRKLLVDYLQFRLSVKEKPLYFNMWKGMLNKLSEMGDDNILAYENIIKQSIERGYLSFYPVNSYSKDYDVRKNKPWEEGVRSSRYTAEELADIESMNKEREAQGLRTKF